MKRINLNEHWTYTVWGNWWDKQSPVEITLPHDWSISQPRNSRNPSGANGAYYPGASIIYIKELDIPADWQGKQLILEFEGVYMNAEVKLNNQFVTSQNYGFTSFHGDITPYINWGGKNTLRVVATNSAQPNCRWYTGTGIYRNVWLLVGEQTSIAPWGVYVTTPKADTNESIVKVNTKLRTICYQNNTYSLKTTILDADNNIVASNDINISTDTKGDNTFSQQLNVSPAKLWSVENPYLYTLSSQLFDKGTLIDSKDTSFGIRTINLSPDKGLLINNTPVNLKGGCIHHDHGILGAASYDRAEVRKVELLKASGFNAVRAHNQPSPAFLDACNRIGLYVIDEAFDCWLEGKNPHDYHVYFAQNWKKDLSAMVLRDRNHPSVIFWSTGNEIPERAGMSDGYELSKKLADTVRSLDTTRPVTNALNNISTNPHINNLEANLLVDDPDYDFFGINTKDFIKHLDIVGYNYLNDRYEKDHKQFPDRIIFGAESFPAKAYDSWEDVLKYPHVVGDFAWAAIDYLGEVGLGHVWRNGETNFLGEYPWHHANCGDRDICGFKRPQSYYRDAVWSNTDTPFIAVEHPKYYGKECQVSSWGWTDVSSIWDYAGYEGAKTHAEIYCSLDEVELILNGKSLGKKPCGKAVKCKAEYTLEYSPGTLTAIGYKAGQEVSRYSVVTAGKATGLRLSADRTCINSCNDLSYITIEAVDENENVVHSFNRSVSLFAYGEGEVIALGSSDPKSTEIYTENRQKAYEGRLQGVIKSIGKTGTITVTAVCSNLPPASLELTVIK